MGTERPQNTVGTSIRRRRPKDTTTGAYGQGRGGTAGEEKHIKVRVATTLNINVITGLRTAQRQRQPLYPTREKAAPRTSRRSHGSLSQPVQATRWAPPALISQNEANTPEGKNATSRDRPGSAAACPRTRPEEEARAFAISLKCLRLLRVSMSLA